MAKKTENIKGQRHIDGIEPTKIAGLFDDNGYEITSALANKPSLCLTCKKDDNPNEELLCNLNRYDQRNSKEFICYAYQIRKD